MLCLVGPWNDYKENKAVIMSSCDDWGRETRTRVWQPTADSPDSEPTPARSDSRQSDVDMPHVVFGGALKRLQREQSSHHVILWWLAISQSVISNSSDSHLSDSQQPAARLVDSRMVDMPHVVFGGALKRLQIEQSSHHVILWWLAISQICWSDCWSDRGFADGSALWVSVLKGQWFKTAKDNTWCVECHMLCLVGSWNDYKENKAVW
jgi:hypothetical protein